MEKERVVEVDPDMAAKWLEGNTHNRPILQGIADKYATSMRTGLWILSTDPIVFSSDGVLLNGQHRLWAVVNSGTTQSFRVLQGIDPRAQLVMDFGAIRSAADNVNLAGNTSDTLTRDDVTVLRYMLTGAAVRPFPVPPEVLEKLWPVYRKEILFVKEACGGRTSTPSSPQVRAICARAMFTRPHAKIQRFLQVLSNGQASAPSERFIIRVRDLLLVEWRTGASRPTARTRYLKIQNALFHFLKGQTPKALKIAEKELFALPESLMVKRLQETHKDLERRSATRKRKDRRPGINSVTPGALVLLDGLRRNGIGMTVAEICQSTGQTQGSTRHQILELLRAGMLRKSSGRVPVYSPIAT